MQQFSSFCDVGDYDGVEHLLEEGNIDVDGRDSDFLFNVIPFSANSACDNTELASSG